MSRRVSKCPLSTVKRFALSCLLFLPLSLLACNLPLKASPIDATTPEPPLLPATPTPSATFEQVAPPSATTFPLNSEQSVAPPGPASPYQNRFYRSEHTYVFEFQDANSTLRYLYTPSSGSLHDLMIQVNDEPPFYPSNYGGPRFLVDGKDLPIWETEPDQFSYTAQEIDNSALMVNWQVQIDKQTLSYAYRLSLHGKTLRLEVTSPAAALGAFTLDRSEETPTARIVTIPYLPFFNVLLCQGHFVSAYVDWQRSEASRLESMNQVISEQSFAFSQTAYYQPNTAGELRPLNEVVYLTVSDSLDEVLPGLAAAISPYGQSLAGKVVLDLWAERPFAEDARLLDELASKGIEDLIVIRHNWQNCGFDDCYPSVLPANPRWGGDEGLLELSRAARQATSLFALHENYVDIYPNAPDYSAELIALDANHNPIPAWFNHTTGIQSFLLSPLRSMEVASRFAPEIHRRYQTTATYLDVSSAVNPGEKVDYNAAIAGNGRWKTTLEAYRQLLAYQRQAHQGPLIGEGGYHFLYVGWADAVLAEDEGREQAGALIPPLVHFDLYRLHPHLVRFGMGFYPWYFATPEGSKWSGYSSEEHYRYMAKEIAYCHGGYVPTPDSLGEIEDVLEFVQREVALVAPIHRRCALARPRRILYQVKGDLVDVEEALFADALWQIFIEYDNGLQVWVNLHPTENWSVSLPWPATWVAYSALQDGKRQDGVGGAQSSIDYFLPPAGWVAAQ